MLNRKARTKWTGSLKEGKGSLETESGNCRAEFDAGSRFKRGDGTNPEEMIGAAHASCFSMELAHVLTQAGYIPKQIDTSASVELRDTDDGIRIEAIRLSTEVDVTGINEPGLNKYAEDAKVNCPVSRALNSVDIHVESKLAKPR